MNDTEDSSEDLPSHERLDKDFHSDQFSDEKRFSEFLGEDFISQFPGVTRNRAELLEYIDRPRPFKDFAMHDVNIRVPSDVALIHGRATYTLLADGEGRELSTRTCTRSVTDRGYVSQPERSLLEPDRPRGRARARQGPSVTLGALCR